MIGGTQRISSRVYAIAFLPTALPQGSQTDETKLSSYLPTLPARNSILDCGVPPRKVVYLHEDTRFDPATLPRKLNMQPWRVTRCTKPTNRSRSRPRTPAGSTETSLRLYIRSSRMLGILNSTPQLWRFTSKAGSHPASHSPTQLLVYPHSEKSSAASYLLE